MHVLPAAKLLDLWEAGLNLSRGAWAQGLLAAACPEASADDLGALSLGERNWRLRLIRESLFGPRLSGCAHCPRCHTAVELDLDTRDLPSPGNGSADAFGAATRDGGVADHLFESDGCEIAYRVPTAADLMAAEHCSDVAEARALLLHRCLTGVRRRGRSVDADDVSPGVLEALFRQMENADPGADVSFTLACPDCGFGWSEPFDVVTFLWTEIDVWARQTLADVHVLASAYGWSERDILALTATRRAHYLELAGT